MTNTTLMLLRQLKLTGMADALTMQQSQPSNYDNLSFEERLQLLVDAEHLERGQRKQQRLLAKGCKAQAACYRQGH